MTSINKTFTSVLNKGIKASEAISDPSEKASVLAEFAKAIAMTGLVSIGVSEDAVAEVEEDPKEALKEKPKKKQKAKEQEETPQEEVATSEEEISEEWTEEMIEKFSEQLERVQGIQEEYDEDTLDEVVQTFSEGVLKSIEEITPLNIDGFLAYFDMLLADAEEAE